MTARLTEGTLRQIAEHGNRPENRAMATELLAKRDAIEEVVQQRDAARAELAAIHARIELSHNGYQETGKSLGMDRPVSHLIALGELLTEQVEMADSVARMERDEARAEAEKLRADLQAMTVEAMRAGREAEKLRAEALAYQQDYIDLRMAGIVQPCESLAAAVVRLHGELGVQMPPMHSRRPVGWFRFMGVTFHPVDGTPEQRERATQLLADKLDVGVVRQPKPEARG